MKILSDSVGKMNQNYVLIWVLGFYFVGFLPSDGLAKKV